MMADAHLTDRQRVELLLPCMILFTIIADTRETDGQQDPQTDDLCRQCEQDLQAEVEALLPKDSPRRQRLYNRARRTKKRVMAPARGQQFGTVMLAVRLLIERLIADGHIVLHAGSRFDQAWSRFAIAIEESPDARLLDTPERRSEADRLCRAMRRALGEQGLYAQAPEVTG